MSGPDQYFDGKTAARHAVGLRFDTAGLRILGDGVDQLWPYGEIRYASLNRDDRPLVFRCQSSPIGASRLATTDEPTIDTLRARCPDLDDRAHHRRQRIRSTLWAATGIVSLGLVIWSSIHFLPRLVAPLVPVAWEEALGDGVVDDISGLFGTLTSREVRRCETADGRLALDILLGRLVSQVRTPYRFRVTVLNVNMVNALAAPGGHIVVFGKLLEEARSPDEVAGVVAHEMGHVISHHPTEAVARSLGVSLVFHVLIGGMGHGVTGAAGEALVNSAYSRDAERDADSIALDILGGAGISSKGMADFLERVARQEGSNAGAMSFVSSHPPSAERAAAARQAIAAGAHPALSPSAWNALKHICG